MSAYGSTANCSLCKSIPEPSYYGSPRLCAWNADGTFNSDHNWNCELANALRSACRETKEWDCFYTRYEDQSYASILIPDGPAHWQGGGMIAMTWYKNRGAIEGAFVISNPKYRKDPSLTLAEAEEAVQILKAEGKITGE